MGALLWIYRVHHRPGLKIIETLEGGLDRLIDELLLWHGGLRVVPQHFGGYSRGARFYPMLYLLTRVGEARDWGTGLGLKHNMLGKMSKLEIHHIFPKALLKKHGYRQTERNAVANFCFQTKDTNLQIGAKPPEEYFPEIEQKHPGALSSQWIPMEPNLWKVENYPAFLEARQELLSKAANTFLDQLRHGEATEQPASPAVLDATASEPSMESQPRVGIPGGYETDEEEDQLLALNAWVVDQGLPQGQVLHEIADSQGQPLALLDLCWPNGLQSGLSNAVAVLLDESEETLALANTHGFRYFTNVDSFKTYVLQDVLAICEPDRSQAG